MFRPGGTIKVAHVKRQLPVFLVCILCGILCVIVAHRAMAALGRPELFLRLVPVAARDGTRVVLRFTNIGNRALALPVGTMEYFVFAPPDDSRRYVAYVYDRDRSRTPDAAAAPGGIVALEPGMSVDVGDVHPLIRNLPAGGGTLKAVYAAPARPAGPLRVWTGVAHSPYLTLEAAGN